MLYNKRHLYRAQWSTVESNLRRGQSGLAEVVIRCRWLERRCVFSRRLKVSNVMASLMAAGNSFQVEKLTERVMKLV